MNLSGCPDCGSAIGKNAYKCRCGWRSTDSSGPQSARIECACAPCQRPAMVRVKLPTGWANLCEPCDARLHRERADAWCRKQGLISTQQRIDYCRAMAKKMFRGVKFKASREPGEDDEIVDKKLESCGT